MATYRIPAEALDDKMYGVTCPWDMIWKGRKYSIGLSPAGRPGREYFQGPMVDDLFGWISEQAVVIAAWYPPDPQRLTLEHGDILEVEGHGRFRVLENEADTWHPHYRRKGAPRLEVI